MKRLNKNQARRHGEIHEALTTAHAEVSEGIDVYNAAVLEAWSIFESAVGAASYQLETPKEKLTAALSDAEEFRTEILELMEQYKDDRSEKWLESDAGEQYQEWSVAWEDLDLEIPEIEVEIEALEPPDEVAAPEPTLDEWGTVPLAADQA